VKVYLTVLWQLLTMSCFSEMQEYIIKIPGGDKIVKQSEAPTISAFIKEMESHPQGEEYNLKDHNVTITRRVRL